MEPPLGKPTVMLTMGLDEYVALKNGRVTLVGPIDVWDEMMMRDIDLIVDWGLKEVELLISSPGGDVTSGIRAIRAIQRARTAGVSVTGIVRGEAASMAFLVLQACSERRMGEGDVLMAHGITSGMIGDTKAIESHQKLLTYWREYFAKLVAGRVRKTSNRSNPRAAAEEYWETIFKDETPVYYTPAEALELGLVDTLDIFDV